MKLPPYAVNVRMGSAEWSERDDLIGRWTFDVGRFLIASPLNRSTPQLLNFFLHPFHPCNPRFHSSARERSFYVLSFQLSLFRTIRSIRPARIATRSRCGRGVIRGGPFQRFVLCPPQHLNYSTSQPLRASASPPKSEIHW
jgi:hypothetical protein